jgi:hypothetical protein
MKGLTSNFKQYHDELRNSSINIFRIAIPLYSEFSFFNSDFLSTPISGAISNAYVTLQAGTGRYRGIDGTPLII